jgi:hypothetical protein
MTTDTTAGWRKTSDGPINLREMTDARRRRDVELLESLVVTTTLAEAYGHPDISKLLANVCVRYAQKIGEPPPSDLASASTDR